MSDGYMVTGRANGPASGQNAFLNLQNESMLTKLAYQDFQRRLGSDLNEKQRQRLVKTVRHYIQEVEQENPESSYPNPELIRAKNKEVLSAVITDFSSYIQRSKAAPPVREEDVSRLDVATRFSQLQNERNTAKATPPAPPNFRITMEDDGPPSLSIFERIKKEREEEANRGAALLQQNMRAETNFKDAQQQSSQFEQNVLADRERMRQAAQKNAASEMANRLVPPDPRRIFMKDILDASMTGQGTPLESILSQSGLANANPTLAVPEALRFKPILPQDNIIRQDDILAYKENEYNLFIYSADRDWVINKSQNRYNFTVNFDPANNGPGQTFAPTATVKFKNITRIELVKTILPIEGIDILQKQEDDPSGNPISSTALSVNVLSFPYLNVYIPELDTNGFGTDTFLNQAFASVQYDANWVSDTNMASKGGYLAMIPKFLKCQKVYTPTPLSTLRKLTISIQRPDGCLVSDTQDTLDIANILSSYWIDGTSTWTTTGTDYADANGLYLWINTGNWFSRFQVNQGDRIQMKGISFPQAYAGNEGAKNDLISFLERPEGHLVVQIAYQSGATAVTDGPNSVGYANYIIIRSRMADPTKGSTSVDTYGKLGTAANNTFLDTLSNTANPVGRLINLSHQTTLVFRVITRDLDPTTRLRPDNM
jgi:hypothetical protein